MMTRPALPSLRTIACAALLAGLALAALLPVYGDEIGWRFQERAWIDGVDKLFSDLCGPNTLAAPPWFMMPVRWYSAVFNTAFAGPAWVRVSGVLYALVLVALLAAIVRRAVPGGEARARLTTLGAGLLALGVLPLLMVMSRPEQPILICTAAALLVALGQAHATPNDRADWLRALTVVVLATIALSYHLKALFLFPVFAAAIWLSARRMLPRLTAGALLAAMGASGALYWIGRLRCPGDPVLNAFFAQHSAGVALAGITGIGELPGILGSLLENIRLLDYAALAAPAVEPMAGWLAPGQVGMGGQRLWRLALDLVWLGALLTGLVCLAAAAARAWRTRTLPPALLLAGALAVTVLGWAATNLQRNVYEAGFVLPLMALAIVLACAAPRDGALGDRLAGAMARTVALGAAVSVTLVAMTYGPSLVRALSATGYVLPAQPHSVSLTGYSATHRDTLAAARLCGLPAPERARGLMIDDVTYPALMAARLPQHQLGVTGLWRGTIRDPVGYLKSRGSDGIVVSCAKLTPALRARARSVGQVCCLGPATGW